jgi:phage I-like protein
METVGLTLALGLEAGKPLPNAFRIFTAGKVETTKGAFLFDEASQALVMKQAADWGNDYPVDYEHAMGMPFAVDPALSGAAAGWFKPEIRNGELWAANVSWTPKASKMLTDREYRYTSARFHVEGEGGRIAELVNVALTNLPATKRMEPLITSRAGDPGKPQEQSMKTLLVALSLAADATEAEALAAIQALKSFIDRMLTLTGAKTLAEVAGTLAAWKADAAQMAALSLELAKYKDAQLSLEIEALIADGKKVGKITPATEPMVRELAKADGIPGLKRFLAAAQAAPKPVGEPEPNVAGAGLTPTELTLAQKHGVDLKKLAEVKAKAIAEGTYPFATA